MNQENALTRKQSLTTAVSNFMESVIQVLGEDKTGSYSQHRKCFVMETGPLGRVPNPDTEPAKKNVMKSWWTQKGEYKCS